ncbi:MAG: hypothetical protein ACC707_02900 [Thiohalomonadales bacterium]
MTVLQQGRAILNRLQSRLVPAHKRGYFAKIEAYRFFEAQHILICEHLKNRHNDEIGEIDRFWMGATLETLSVIP